MMRLGLPLLAAGMLVAADMAIAAPPTPPPAAPVQVSLTCDAITYKGTLDAATTKELEPIHDLAGVGAVLKRRGIAFERSRGTLTVTLAEQIRAQINALPPGEPIVLPQPDGGVICVMVPAADSI